MQLFLAGGGSAEQSGQIDALFASEIPGGKRVLYWSMALRGVRPPGDCLAWIQVVLGRFDIDDIAIWHDFSGHAPSDLNDFDAIYVGGGNTYQLLDDLRSSGFDVHLSNFAKTGRPVYGGSAGAVVLGRDIRTIDHIDTNAVGLEDLSALNLAGGNAIWVHYDQADDPLIHKCASHLGCTILAIAENGGVELVDGEITWAFGGVFHFDQTGKRALA